MDRNKTTKERAKRDIDIILKCLEDERKDFENKFNSLNDRIEQLKGAIEFLDSFK